MMAIFDFLGKKENNKSSQLSEHEISKVLTKIRKIYKEYAEKYGSSMFNLEAFNNRYAQALRDRTNLTVFLAAETQAIDDIKQKAEESIERKKQEEYEQRNKYANSFEKQADDMLNEFNKRIRKYPRKELCEEASEELERLYGAMSEFYGCILIIRNIFSECGDNNLEMTAKLLDTKFADRIIESAGRPTQIWMDYILAFDRPDKEAESDRMEKTVLKENGLFLNETISRVKKLEEGLDSVKPEKALKLDKSFRDYYPRIAKSFEGKSKAEAFAGCRMYGEAILRDFRLHNFKKTI